MTILSSLDVLAVTNAGPANDDKVDIITTLGFHHLTFSRYGNMVLLMKFSLMATPKVVKMSASPVLLVMTISPT